MHTEIKRYFQLHDLPFEQTPNLKFFCGFELYRDALDTIVHSLEKGEPIIKVVGEVGTGKTLLCRKLIDALDQQDMVTLYIHNPLLNTETLFRLIADELAVPHAETDAEYYLYKNITDKLLSYYHENKHVVLLVDEAQTLSDASLEALRLLTNLESEHKKLIQIILLGQPELDERLSLKKFRQLKQRIGFNVRLTALHATQVSPYLQQRLLSAGHANGKLFSEAASKLIFKVSHGIPRVINIVAYKALLASYVQGKLLVDKEAMRAAILDSKETLDSCSKKKNMLSKKYGFVILLVVLVTFVLISVFLLIR
ncbi:MAG: AAA family ATPase [Gammaproteobacteria bacterium]|nr:AAA family ATPase [Gammaproteobacteria bacterium]